MATTGKKGKKTKTKTLPLTSFLADGGGTGATTTKTISWAEEMEEDDNAFSRRNDQKSVVVPTAPRATRGPDIPDENIPKYPPFTAYIANLSYELTKEDVMDFFGHLGVKDLRLPREGDPETGRLRGTGYVDFDNRKGLIEALTMNDHYLQNRKIRVDLAERNDRDGGGGGRGYGSRYGEEMGDEHKSTNWRSDPPPEIREDDRDRRDRRGGFDRYEQPNDRRDRGFGGYRDDRGSRDDHRGFGQDRDRYSDRNDRFERRRSPVAPRERPKLQLAKKSNTEDRAGETSGASSSIFGGAKPVDTAKKEAEIEQKIKERASYPRKADDSQAAAAAATDQTGGKKSSNVFGEAKPVDTAKKDAEIERKLQQEKAKSSAVFGGAKPVDTTSREREVEERLKKLDVEGGGGGKESRRPPSPQRPEESHNGDSDRQSSSSSTTTASKPAVRPPKANVFGAAKPVDTAAREREIEEKLKETSTDHRRSDGRGVRRGRGHEGSDRRDHHGGGHEGSDRRDHHSPPPKLEEEKAPNFVGSNKFSSLVEGGEDAGSGHDSN